MARLKTNVKTAHKSIDNSSIVIVFIVLIWGLLIEPKLFIFPFLLALFLCTIVVHKKRKRQRDLVNSNINEIDLMSGIQFEEYLSLLFKEMGYKVEHTPASGDYGADLILKKRGRKIAVQAKRYKNSVGISAVQQIIGAKNYYKADETWVVTNSYYSKPALKLSAVNNVNLIDRNQLIRLATRYIR
ncbi:restriction endonuclease [Priestia aryabhattai]